MSRHPTDSRYAALDVGSNTVRLLVASPSDGGFTPLHSSQAITRLGENSHEDGLLKKAAMERTLKGVETLLSGASSFKPFKILITATHAVRRAKNRESFALEFKNRIKLNLEVIDWKTEASLTLKGASMVVGGDSPVLLFDIGGGSTEFVYRDHKGNIHSAGTDLGVVRLVEKYIKSAPLAVEEYERLREYLKIETAKAAGELKVSKPFTLIGTAGTITSMAALHFGVYPYDPEKINNKVLKSKDVEDILRFVGPKTIEERSKLPPLENGREDLIIPGIAIVQSVMEVFGCDHLTVSDSSLREGVILSLMDGSVKGEQA